MWSGAWVEANGEIIVYREGERFLAFVFFVKNRAGVVFGVAVAKVVLAGQWQNASES
jgi:hypothetical protein